MSGFAELARRMAPVCAEAVDDMEIAAVLEADGVTDALAAQRYGAPDVFALAARLRRRHPRQPRPAPPTAGPWRATPVKHLLRGALFALPALCSLAVAGLGSGWRAGTVLVVAVLASWAASQCVAFLGYARLSYGDRAAAARLLRGALLWSGLPLLVVIVVTAGVLRTPLAVAVVAGGQAAYLLAATVLLVLDAEWLLLAALAPGTVGAALGWALGSVRSLPTGCAVAVSVLATVILAVHTTRGGPAELPGRAEFADGLPHALLGLSFGALLLVIPSARTFLPPAVVGVPTGAAVAALVPLSLSMGAAEWLLYRYRAATHRALQRAYHLRSFALRAGLTLVRTTAGYLGVLAGLGAVGAALVTIGTGAPPPVRTLVGYGALGGALFMALLLVTFRLRAAVTLACAATAGAEVALLVAAAHLHRRLDPERLQAVSAAVLFAVLLCYALGTLRRATRHH